MLLRLMFARHTAAKVSDLGAAALSPPSNAPEHSKRLERLERLRTRQGPEHADDR